MPSLTKRMYGRKHKILNDNYEEDGDIQKEKLKFCRISPNAWQKKQIYMFEFLFVLCLCSYKNNTLKISLS